MEVRDAVEAQVQVTVVWALFLSSTLDLRTPSRTRTGNLRLLKTASLPIGLRGQGGATGDLPPLVAPGDFFEPSKPAAQMVPAVTQANGQEGCLAWSKSLTGCRTPGESRTPKPLLLRQVHMPVLLRGHVGAEPPRLRPNRTANAKLCYRIKILIISILFIRRRCALAIQAHVAMIASSR